MTAAALQLRNFDAAGFLRDQWQRKPLLIRSAWDCWTNPVEPDELAGLACEELVQSRIVTRSEQAWELEHGPFPESRFTKPSGDPWTLLVQSVDHHLPSVAALLDPFRFIPNWRVDDVMVSYASDGGGGGWECATADASAALACATARSIRSTASCRSVTSSATPSHTVAPSARRADTRFARSRSVGASPGRAPGC